MQPNSGTVSGATLLAILGATSAEPDAGFFSYTAGGGAVSGALLGGISGTVIGGITSLFKNSNFSTLLF